MPARDSPYESSQCHPDSLHVDLDWLERECLHTDRPPKLVVVVNPSNPTGVLLSKPELDRLADICKRAGSWLVLDNTYEDFVYDGREHYCPAGDHIIHVFSFSKAFGTSYVFDMSLYARASPDRHVVP